MILFVRRKIEERKGNEKWRINKLMEPVGRVFSFKWKAKRGSFHASCTRGGAGVLFAD